MEIVKDFAEQELQQQRQTLEIVEDFACEARNLRKFGGFRDVSSIFLHVFFTFLHYSTHLLFYFIFAGRHTTVTVK